MTAEERARQEADRIDAEVIFYFQTENARQFSAREALAEAVVGKEMLDAQRRGVSPTPSVTFYGKAKRKQWLYELIERAVKD